MVSRVWGHRPFLWTAPSSCTSLFLLDDGRKLVGRKLLCLSWAARFIFPLNSPPVSVFTFQPDSSRTFAEVWASARPRRSRRWLAPAPRVPSRPRCLEMPALPCTWRPCLPDASWIPASSIHEPVLRCFNYWGALVPTHLPPQLIFFVRKCAFYPGSFYIYVLT